MEFSQEFLKECFAYNPDTGSLLWRSRPKKHFGSIRAQRLTNTKMVGREVGHVYKTRTIGRVYRSTKIGGIRRDVHRIIWVIVHGVWPENIDHINGDGLDNRIVNIREVTKSENSKNTKIHSRNTTGQSGVCRSWNKWRARINVDGIPMELGVYETLNGAVEARRAAEIKYGYHPNHGRAGNG